MREICTSGSMSGERKRDEGIMPALPRLSSTLLQFTGLWGFADCPYRLFDVDDLYFNTLGAGVGWLLWNMFFHIVPDPSAPEHEMWYRRWKTPPAGDGPRVP